MPLDFRPVHTHMPPRPYWSRSALTAHLGRLTEEVLNDWVRNVGASVEATMTPDRLDVATLLNAETAKALKAFSALANKNTGATHPLDRDRWFKFIILAHLGSAQLDTETLYRWFSEEEG